MNKVIFMGRLTRDPEERTASTGNQVASFSIAVDRRFKREGQPEADFFNCTAFGKQAEFVGKFLKKGTKILLEGEIQNNNYTNKDGQMVYGMQVIANNIEFAESKNAQSGASSSAGSYGGAAPEPSGDAGDGFMNIPDGIEEELPFN